MSKKLGVVELVTRVGDDRLFFQNLDDVATNYRLLSRHIAAAWYPA